MRRIRFAGSRRTSPRSRLARIGDYLLTVAILGLIALVAARLNRVDNSRLVGKPVVNDGDSLTFGAVRVRLSGIDAPEFDQTCRRGATPYACGREARKSLADMVAGGPVICEGWEKDRYGRVLATCTAGGIDLNRALVEAGWAVAFGGYEAEEQAARHAERGIWAGDFDRPRHWRESHGDIAEAEHDAMGSVINWLRAVFGFS